MKPLKVGLLAVVLWWRFGISAVNWRARNAIAFVPDLGMAYNRIQKNANTTVVMLLREMTTGRVEDRDEAKNRSLKYSDLTFRQIWELRHSFFFVVVRDPYSRVLSAFLEKFQLESYRRNIGAFDLTPEGFAAFVQWLKDGGLDKNGHWNLQTRAMLLPPSKYDRVVRFETLKDGMLTMFDSLDLKPPEGRLDGLYPTDVNKQTSSSRRLHEFYTPRAAEIVAELYARDFELLDYSKNLPPRGGEAGQR